MRELKQRIKEAHYDAVLVIRPKAFRKETEEVGTKAIYMPPTVYQSFWPYWDMAFKQYSAKGSYLKGNTIVSAEFYFTAPRTKRKRQPQTVLTAWLVEILPRVLGYHV